MNLIKIFFIMLVIVSCQEKQIWQEIEIGKTIKIESNSFNLENNNYIYNWSKPVGVDEGVEYIIQHDKILVTAKTPGEYKIELTIENLSNKIVHKESFFLNAIPETNKIETQSIENPNDNDADAVRNSADTPKKIIKNKTRYTIQVASWPNLDQAVKDKEELISDGYDAYIEKYINEEKNIIRWRVRIGNFEDQNLASKIKKELSNKRGKDIWIDKIK